jgi:hypothetical protein
MFLLCCALKCPAQIRGEVVDLTGARIPRTTIRVLDQTSRRTVETAQTDARGLFDLRDLSPGQYTIVFSSVEFVPAMVEVDTAKAGIEIFRVVRLRVIDCDHPQMNCDSFSQTPISDPHPIVAEGALSVSTADEVDLDARALVAAASRSASFRIAENRGGLYLSPLNGAKLFNVCVVLPGEGLKRREITSLRVDGLGQNSEICMKTIHHRYSKIFLTREVQPGDLQIMVYVVTRDR